MVQPQVGEMLKTRFFLDGAVIGKDKFPLALTKGVVTEVLIERRSTLDGSWIVYNKNTMLRTCPWSSS